MEILIPTLLKFVFSVKGLVTLAGVALGGYALMQKLRAKAERHRREAAEKDCLVEKQRRLAAEANAQVNQIQTQTARKMADITDRRKTEEVKIVQADDDDIGRRLDNLYPGDDHDHDGMRDTSGSGDRDPQG